MKISRSILRKIIKESIDEMALATHRELEKNLEGSDSEEIRDLSSFIQKNLSKNENKLRNWFQNNRTFGDADVHVLPFAGRSYEIAEALEDEGIEVYGNARNYSCDITSELLNSLNMSEQEVDLNKNNVILIPCVSAAPEGNTAISGESYTPWRMLHSIFDCDVDDPDLDDLQEDIPGATSVAPDRFAFVYDFFDNLPYEDILNCSDHGSFKIARAKEKQRNSGKTFTGSESADFANNQLEAFYELLVSAFIRKERGPNFIKTPGMSEEDYIEAYKTIKEIADGARQELINQCIIVNVIDL